jgi:NifU-like protein involved in Fe-S cluster formation
MTTGRTAVKQHLIALVAAFGLAGCGVDTASTAATAAAIKKQEIEQGKKTMEQMQKNIGQTMDQAGRRAERAGDEK